MENQGIDLTGSEVLKFRCFPVPSFRRKKPLDICLYGNVSLVHGTCSYNVGCFQRRRRALPAGDIELPRVRGAPGGRHCGNPGPGAAIRVKTPPRSTRRRPGSRAPRRPTKAVSNQRRGDPASARMDQHVRALLATAVESSQRACRGKDEESPAKSKFKEQP